MQELAEAGASRSRQEPAKAGAGRSRQTQRQEQPEPVGVSQGQLGPTDANICREGGVHGSKKENVAAGFSLFGFCCF